MSPGALRGCELEIETPVEVGRAAGHHWFTTLHPFDSRHIVCAAAVADDRAQGRWPSVLYLSADSGRSWREALRLHYGPVSMPCGPRTRLLMPYEVWPSGPGQARHAQAQGYLLQLTDDSRLAAEEVPVKLGGFPRDLAPYNNDELCLLTNGNILPRQDGSLLTTVYGMYAGDTRYTLWAMSSRDQGRTWQYLAEVARWQDLPEAPEGPDESHSARLADGRLMCVYRVGSGNEHSYCASHSPDDGVTWSPPQALAGTWSVEPQLVCLEDGTLLLSGGRTGLFLWVCPEGDGRVWQPVNLGEHHNAALTDPALHFPAAFCAARGDAHASTSYTSMVSLGHGQVLLSYDRLGNGWSGAPGPLGPHDIAFSVRLRARRTP